MFFVEYPRVVFLSGGVGSRIFSNRPAD